MKKHGRLGIKTFYYGNSKCGGIYKILNTTNGRFYYGSTKKFKNRCQGHFSSLRANKHKNTFLQRDYNKCGKRHLSFM